MCVHYRISLLLLTRLHRANLDTETVKKNQGKKIPLERNWMLRTTVHPLSLIWFPMASKVLTRISQPNFLVENEEFFFLKKL